MVISFAASPYFTKPLPETVDLRPAQDFTLSCEAAAEPAAEYKWYIDGVLQRVFQSSYEIETADIGDTGIYQVSLNRAFWLAMAVCTHFIFFFVESKSNILTRASIFFTILLHSLRLFLTRNSGLHCMKGFGAFNLLVVLKT